MTWNRDEVQERTRTLEQGIVERLARKGVELRLSDDPFDHIDGTTYRDGILSSVVEIKTRNEPLRRFAEWGTVAFDHAKLSHLRSEAFKWGCWGVLLVLTADNHLLWHRLTALHIVERRLARKNHFTEERIRKDLELVPLRMFKSFDQLGGEPLGWDEIGDDAAFRTEVAERAAVMHFDGGVDAVIAEALAETEVRERWQRIK